jgi:hypothetical protein
VVELHEAPPVRSTATWSVWLRRWLTRHDAGAVSAWVLAFVLVTSLALDGGGYDIVARSDAGIVVWWLVLLGALAGILPAHVGRAGWIAIGLLAAFAGWSAAAISWSQSAEQTVIEVGRLATYLGVLVLAIMLQGRSAARHTVNGLASAIGVVTVLAVLSRLHPQAFSPNQHFAFLGSVPARKLSYPLGYWNALADFAAMGVPLLLAAALGARTRLGRGLAAAVLPLSAACVYLTISRGGAVAVGLGIVVFLALVPRRLEALATLIASAAGSFVLLRAIAARGALTSGLPTPAAIHEGNAMIGLAVVVCAAAGAAAVLVGAAARHPARPALLAPDRSTTTRIALAGAGLLLVGAVLAGAPHRIVHVWDQFKAPTGVVAPGADSSVFTRLQAANGNSRYQIWQAALHANATAPWRGIGPGTFQYWWTAHPTAPGFLRNAHSLYFETLAETGIIGLALLGGLLGLVTVIAVRRALHEPPALRLWLAGASAAFAVFLFSAALEWVWQLAAIAATALILAAVIIAGHAGARGRSAARRTPPPAAAVSVGGRARQAALALLAVAALGAVLVPLAETLAVRASQSAAAGGDLSAALADSRSAAELAPYASSAHLQEALVLEAADELGPAASAAATATTDSPTDWTTWLTLARIDARRGATAAALAALADARRLNPRSVLFQLP